VVDFYAGEYLCRDHIIGFDEAGDLADARRQWMDTLGPKSIGIMFDRASIYTGQDDLEDSGSDDDDSKGT
jgi:hypothetical protein